MDMALCLWTEEVWVAGLPDSAMLARCLGSPHSMSKGIHQVGCEFILLEKLKWTDAADHVDLGCMGRDMYTGVRVPCTCMYRVYGG